MRVTCGRAAAVALAVLSLATPAGPARACPACVPSAGPTIAQRLARADAVLIAAPAGDGWTVAARVKDSVTTVPDDVRRGLGAPGGSSVVIAREASGPWSVLGRAGADTADWLRVVGSTAEPSDVAAWREHVALHVPRLEDAHPLVAEIAYEEVARAPYEAMRPQKASLDAARIGAWLDDPKLASRGPLYTLLLGIAGGPEATARIASLVSAAERDRDVTNLAARLVADMELRGTQRVAWIEKAYLTDRQRSPQEIQAVLVALQVQGTADAEIRRARVVRAFRTFIRSRHALAGYAAPVLLSWQAWDAVPDYVALLKTKAPQHPASTIALLHYLESSPGTEGPAAAGAARRASPRPGGRSGL